MILSIEFPCRFRISRLLLRCSNIDYMMSITMVFFHVSILGHMSSVGMIFHHVILVQSRKCQQDFLLYFFSSFEKIQKFRLLHLRELSRRWSIPISFNL